MQQSPQMLKALMYLFKHHMQTDCQLTLPNSMIKDELTEAGFSDDVIHQVFAWLVDLDALQAANQMAGLSQSKAIRVYSDYEYSRLSLDAIDFITQLTNEDTLTPIDRETIINQALSLDVDHITVAIIKWVTLIVLFNSPESAEALARVESLVLDEPTDSN